METISKVETENEDLKKILDDAKSQFVEVTKKVDEVNKKADDIDAAARKVKNAIAEVSNSQALLGEYNESFLLPRMVGTMRGDPESALKVYGQIAEPGNEHLIRTILVLIYNELIATPEPDPRTGKIPDRSGYRSFLKGARDQGFLETATDNAIAYYLRLVSLILDRRPDDYKSLIAEFHDFANANAGQPIQSDMAAAFDPAAFTTFIDGLAAQGKISPQFASDMRSKVTEVWNLIPHT